MDADIETGTDASPDGGVGADAARDASTTDAATSVATCGNGAIVPGAVPIGLTNCGTISGATATEGIATGLTNGVTTRIAVSAVDNFGNPGPVSAVVCATPNAVDDFFDGYKNAGGGAGCAIGPTVTITAATATGLLFACCGIVGLRLRRRRARRSVESCR